MRNPCTAFVKNRKLRARVACGRSGRVCIVSGQSYEVRLVLCGRHRKVENRRFQVVVQKTDRPLELSKTRLTEITGFQCNPYFLDLADLKKTKGKKRFGRNRGCARWSSTGFPKRNQSSVHAVQV